MLREAVNKARECSLNPVSVLQAHARRDFISSDFMGRQPRAEGKSLGVFLSVWKAPPVPHLFTGQPRLFVRSPCPKYALGRRLWGKGWLWGIGREVWGVSWNREFCLT